MAGILGDEISRQMDADLFGRPRRNLPWIPKLSGEMDKDLGLAPSRPWAGAIKPPEPEEPGYLGALGKRDLYRVPAKAPRNDRSGDPVYRGGPGDRESHHRMGERRGRTASV